MLTAGAAVRGLRKVVSALVARRLSSPPSNVQAYITNEFYATDEEFQVAIADARCVAAVAVS